MSVFAFAQVSKNDNTNTAPSRKVLDADVKDLPVESEISAVTGDIKIESKQKIKGDQTASTKKTLEKQTFKMTEDVSKTTSSPSTIKMTSETKSIDAENTTIKQTGTQSQTKSSDFFLKIGDIKGEK